MKMEKFYNNKHLGLSFELKLIIIWLHKQDIPDARISNQLKIKNKTVTG